MLAVMANEAANKIDYVEFQARDVAATKKFFEQLFGWKFTDYGPDYTSFADGRIAGGFSRADKASTIASGGVLIVFYHPRLEEVRQRARPNLRVPRVQIFRDARGYGERG